MIPGLRSRLGTAEPSGPPWDAIAAGEPLRARATVDRIDEDLTPERAEALDWLLYVLESSWAPGPTGFVPFAAMPPPPPTPQIGNDLVAAWWGRVMPGFLQARSMASVVRRSGEDRARELWGSTLGPLVEFWAALAAGRAELVARVRLEQATILRLAGLDSHEALDAAEEAARAAGPEAIAACLLERGDAALTPLGSPETLGLFLDDREAAPVLGDASARATASACYDEVHRLVPEARIVLGIRAATLLHVGAGHGEAAAVLEGLLDDAAGAERALVLTHLAIEKVLAGDLASSRPGPVPEIVVWARERGGPAYALGCGALLHAAACAARDAGGIDASFALLDLAHRLHEPFDDVMGAMVVASSRIDLYEVLRCAGATVTTIEETWNAAAAQLRRGEPVPQFVLSSMLVLLTRAISQLFIAQDAAGFVEVRERIADLLAREKEAGTAVEEEAPPALAILEQAGPELEEVGRDRGGPRAGGRPFEETERWHREFAVRMLRHNDRMCAVMESNVRAVVALDRGDAATAAAAFAESIDRADAAGDSTLGLFPLVGNRDHDELVRRLDRLRDDGVDLGAEREAQFRLEAGQPAVATGILDAAGLADPPPVSDAWRPQWSPCVLRARIALAAGRYDDAERHAREGIARFDAWFPAVSADTFRISVLDDGDVRRLFEILAEVADHRGDARSTLHAADRLRSLALGALTSESLAGGPASAAVRRRREAHATWNGMFDRRRVAWRDRDPEILRRSAADLDAAQRELDVAVAGAPTAPIVSFPGVDAGIVAAALEPDTLLVHYTATDETLFLTTVTRDGPDVVRHDVRRRDLFGTAARVHRAWSVGVRARPADVAALGEALLEPLRKRLEEHPRLVVVPNGALHPLPFAALELAGAALVERWDVSQLPAAALIPRLVGCAVARPGRGSVVVGDPVAAAGLPGARVEAVTVARLLGATPLVGERADEASVRGALAAAGGIAHFATHGLLDEQAPDLSSLALAGDELTVAELVGMGLDTDLAVLSACDSGRGEVTQGGDVVGLARGLLAAGVRHAVVTSWPVDDQVACLVMVRFVEHVVAGVPVAVALAAAQREVRALSSTEREERFRSLAREADLPADGSGTARRRTRDVRPPPGIATADPRHPSWWAGFVHLGV